MSDIIPADQVQLDSPAPAEAIPQDQVIPDEPKGDGSSSEILNTVRQGLEQGFAGPLGTLAETKAFGTPEEEITANETAHPYISAASKAAGLLGGALTGTGEAGLIANAAERLIPESATLLGKLGAGAIKAFTENALLQGGDEVSKAMLNEQDPETPVASALAHMGAAGLFGAPFGAVGAGVGSKLKAIADAKMGTKAMNEIANFGSEWNQIKSNPDKLGSLVNELTDFHSQMTAASDEINGVNGLKAQAIDHLSQSVDPSKVTDHVNLISRSLDKAPDALSGSNEYQNAISNWKNKVIATVDLVTGAATNTPAPADVFTATDQLKRSLQKMAKFDATTSNPFRDAAGNMSHTLRKSLENPEVWGELGDLQRTVNKAQAEFIPTLKDVSNVITRKSAAAGENIIDPGKINTYLNQLGKPNAEVKQTFMENFIKKGEALRDEVNSAYGRLGLDAPMPPTALNTVKNTYGEVTPGAEFARHIYNFGIPQSASHIGQGALGAGIGYEHGGVKGAISGAALGLIAPYAENMIAAKLRDAAVPAVLKGLGSGSAQKIAEILDHANNASQGAQKINKNIENLFKVGTQQGVAAYASEKDREKIKGYLEKGGINEQIQQQIYQQNRAPAAPPPQGYAEGGEVKHQPKTEKDSPLGPVLKGTKGLSDTYPAHDMMLQMARGRVSNYLNSLRPQGHSLKLPYDKVLPDKEKERAYHKAIDLANEPLAILNHVKEGTLTSDSLNHFKQLYPELHNHLSQKITQKMSEGSLDDEKHPPYKVKQAMSLFLGSPLDSTMTQPAMQSIQSIYTQRAAMQQAAPQPGEKPKKGSPSKLNKLSSNLQTPDQARVARAEKS